MKTSLLTVKVFEVLRVFHWLQVGEYIFMEMQIGYSTQYQNILSSKDECAFLKSYIFYINLYLEKSKCVCGGGGGVQIKICL